MTSYLQAIAVVRTLYNKLVNTLYRLYLKPQDYEIYIREKDRRRRIKNKIMVLRAIKKLVSNEILVETWTEAVYEKVRSLKESEIDKILYDFECDGLIYPTGYSRRGYIFSLISRGAAQKV